MLLLEPHGHRRSPSVNQAMCLPVTRAELLQPRPLPAVQIGDLLLIHDAGAYGYTMSSNYNSLGRAPRYGSKTASPTSSHAEKPSRTSYGLNALPLSSHTSHLRPPAPRL